MYFGALSHTDEAFFEVCIESAYIRIFDNGMFNMHDEYRVNLISVTFLLVTFKHWKCIVCRYRKICSWRRRTFRLRWTPHIMGGIVVNSPNFEIKLEHFAKYQPTCMIYLHDAHRSYLTTGFVNICKYSDF